MIKHFLEKLLILDLSLQKWKKNPIQEYFKCISVISIVYILNLHNFFYTEKYQH